MNSQSYGRSGYFRLFPVSLKGVSLMADLAFVTRLKRFELDELAVSGSSEERLAVAREIERRELRRRARQAAAPPAASLPVKKKRP